MSNINIYQPSLGSEELESISTVFETNWIGRGRKTKDFEHLFAQSCGIIPGRFVTTTSCTEALFQICEYLALSSQDEVILPSISFIGAYNAVKSTQAKPVFCDVDPYNLNTSLDHIKERVNANTRAIILIHYGGIPIADILSIAEFCTSNNIILIEDNACSPFSKINGLRTGTIGSFGAWSFDAMKILCCGDGSIIHGKQLDDIDNLRRRLYMGLTSESGLSSDEESEWWTFDVNESTRRQIMNDITASIAISQLQKIPSFLRRRREIAEFYDKNISLNRKSNHFQSSLIESSYYMYWLTLESREDRNRLASYLKQNGVYTTFRYYPLHRVESIRKRDCIVDLESLSGASFAADHTLCIPLHQSLTDNDILKIVKLINKFIDQ